MTDTQARFGELIRQACSAGALRKLTFSKCSDGGPDKIAARLASLRGKPALALSYTDSQGNIKHKNLSAEELAGGLAPFLSSYCNIHLSTTAGDADYLRSKKGKETLIGHGALSKALTATAPAESAELLPYNRKVERLVPADAPFLYPLGIADANGRIHDKKQAKYRQINRFLEHVETVYASLPTEGELFICDLCCGKSYLSFALYYYLTAIKGRCVDMLCADLKEDVIAYCRGVAADAGFGGMRFYAGDVRNLVIDRRPSMVVSLHACDIATDLVLSTAIRMEAEVILSTPCCHRYLKGIIDCDELGFATQFGHLSNRLCDVLTDAVRVARLRAEGYRAEAVELIDPEDTPKNTLIRAIRNRHFDPASKSALEAKAAYRAALAFLVGDPDKYQPEEQLS